MSQYLLAILAILQITAMAQLPQPQPDLVIELCRHGARAPTTADYDSTWSQSELGQLLPAGMRQHYILGQELLKAYPNILGQPFSWDNIFILADTYNRTIQSAISQLSGIYNGRGPGLGTNFNQSIAVPPYSSTEADTIINNLANDAALPNNLYPFVIPVVNLTNFTQGMLFDTIGIYTCPNMDTWIAENMEDENAAQAWVLFNETISYMNNYSITPLTNGLDVADFADNIFSNTMAGKALPGGFPADNAQLLSNMTYAYSWWMTYIFQGQKVENYFSAYDLVMSILSYAEGAINGTNLNTFMLLSAHDVNVASILGVLEVLEAEKIMANFNASTNNEPEPYPFSYWPPYASSLIFELYNATTPYLRVVYNGEAIPLCSGGTVCDWSQFQWIMMNGIGNYTADDVNRVCGYNQSSVAVDNPSTPTSLSASTTGFIVAIVVLAVALGLALCKIVYDDRKHKKQLKQMGVGMLESEKSIL